MREGTQVLHPTLVMSTQVWALWIMQNQQARLVQYMELIWILLLPVWADTPCFSNAAPKRAVVVGFDIGVTHGYGANIFARRLKSNSLTQFSIDRLPERIFR